MAVGVPAHRQIGISTLRTAHPGVHFDTQIVAKAQRKESENLSICSLVILQR